MNTYIHTNNINIIHITNYECKLYLLGTKKKIEIKDPYYTSSPGLKKHLII